ncbi:MAG: DsbA family protein [Nitrososphaeraceae archaeon]
MVIDCAWYFVIFELLKIHPYAQHAAEATESSSTQNKFWEIYDYLYEYQQALDGNHLEKYASKLGLDLAQFNHDMSSHAHARRIHEDFLGGVRSGVNGTPIFYISGIRYNDSRFRNSFKRPQISLIKKNIFTIRRRLYANQNFS